MVRTLMAHSPGLAKTIIMVPTGHSMHNPPLARTIFHGPKPVQVIEILLYFCVLSSLAIISKFVRVLVSANFSGCHGVICDCSIC